MPHQLPQIAFRHRRPPDARETFFHQQLQHVGGIARVGLLFAHHRRPDLGRVPDPQLVSQLRQHALKPARVPGGLDSHQNWACQLAIEGSRFTAAVFQTTLDQFARFLVQHRDLLVACMQITTYNLHVLGSFLPSLGLLERTKFTRRLRSRHGYLIRQVEASFHAVGAEYESSTKPFL